jgi:D-alanyl-D-alanine dipeptidase
MIGHIPNYTELRLRKTGYDTDERSVLDVDHPLHKDPLEDLREFGFEDAESYYSKPNPMTGEPVEGVPSAPLVRRDIAFRLQQAERLLSTDPDVREALGAPAHLRIRDAIRPYPVQVHAYEVAWPAIIRKMNPGISEEQLASELPKHIAKPNRRNPHGAGAAVDVRLVNLNTDKPFNRGYKGGKIKGPAYPDFHEGYHLTGESDIPVDSIYDYEDPKVQQEIVMGRRVLHWAMNEAGLYVNPTEIWHYGRGDALSTYVQSAITGKRIQPYYGDADLPQWYVDQMKLVS